MHLGYVCVGVRTVCMQMCIYIRVYMWGGQRSTVHLVFLRQGLTSLESITQAKQADQQSLGVLLSPLMPNPVLGFLMCHLPRLFFLGSGGLNPGLHACKANTSLAEPCSQAETKTKQITKSFIDKADPGIQIRSVWTSISHHQPNFKISKRLLWQESHH